MQHIISSGQFNRSLLLEVLQLSAQLDQPSAITPCSQQIVSTLFFEPSTRTRLSFQSAAHRLGAQVLGFDSPDNCSIQKGESLKDTIKMVSNYCEAIVMRHPHDGAANYVADFAGVPLINAGDGSNEHPSQTMLDLYTIYKEQQKLDGLTVAFVGDLKHGRTVHSLTKALLQFDVEFIFVATPSLQIPDYLRQQLERRGARYRCVESYRDALPEIDVLYMTRVQKERFADLAYYEAIKDNYVISRQDLVDVKNNLIILHPLPRLNEIASDVDDSGFARYFEQAQNGIPVRKALIGLALEHFTLSEPIAVKIPNNVSISSELRCQNSNCISHHEKTENKTYRNDQSEHCYYCHYEL